MGLCPVCVAIGLATYSFLWPAAGVSRSIFLTELYVSEKFRRSGIGAELMKEVFNISRAHRCSRVEWATEIDNVNAQRFYAALGAIRVEGKVSYRMNL